MHTPDGRRRVVVTGMGIVSCLGNDLDSVAQALRHGYSGVQRVPEHEALGLRSLVAGIPPPLSADAVPRKWRRFMGDAALMAWHAAHQALVDAALPEASVRHPRTGLAVGSGVGSPFEHFQAMETLKSKGLSRVPPYLVPRVMGNTTAGNLAVGLGIQGVNYSLVSACATGAHNIGHATDLIRWGKQDVMLAGSAEELRWTSTVLFDAMGALSTRYNDATASRPYDAQRDGFVIAGGAGILLLEALDHALARGANIHGEVVGHGACSDGMDMVNPHADGAARAMQLALEDGGLDHVDYINTHGTSTRAGDVTELDAIRAVFGKHDQGVPRLSSTKGLTGHPIAAAGAHEAIYGLLMMRHGFVSGCAHIDTLDPGCDGLPLLRHTTPLHLNTVMSNSFGFGGTNASLILRRWINA